MNARQITIEIPSLTAKDALEVLAKATEQVALNRADQFLCISALQTLREQLEPAEPCPLATLNPSGTEQ